MFWFASGNGSLYFGEHSGSSMTSGADNTFLGFGTGSNLSTGSRNIMMGRQAGQDNSIGSDNVFLGYKAGRASGGSGNVFIGSIRSRIKISLLSFAKSFFIEVFSTILPLSIMAIFLQRLSASSK